MNEVKAENCTHRKMNVILKLSFTFYDGMFAVHNDYIHSEELVDTHSAF